MTDSRRRLASLALGASLCTPTGPLGASTAAAAQTARFAGDYVSTQVTGASVIRLELLLRPDGRAQLRAGASRYTQRPTAKEATSSLETGRWEARGGRLVLHIEHSSTETDERHAAQYEERTFVLAGCELRLLGASAAFTFDKQHCSAAAPVRGRRSAT